MSYTISGIVTSFKYTGNLPHTYLLSDFVFIPLDSRTKGFKGHKVRPFEELTLEIKRYLKKLSFDGQCSYIEADFFAGVGEQFALVYENGQVIAGPIKSNDAINQALAIIGVYSHNNKVDEFDTLDLGRNRSNEEWFI